MKQENYPFDGSARWISLPGRCRGSRKAPVLPAPYLRKNFFIQRSVHNPRIRICGIGFYELYVNGQRVGDQVLDPAPSQYDRRARYVTHSVGPLLKKGENTVGVILGNGWYNNYDSTWHFDAAPWNDYPKMLLQLEDDNGLICASDPSWRAATGAILFDGLRNGETCDARLEPGGWTENGFDDSLWEQAAIVSPPGGILSPQFQPPCKVMRTIRPVDFWTTRHGATVYDAGQDMAGWARLQVRAAAGTQFTVTYAEVLDERKNIDRKHISMHVPAHNGNHFQADTFIASGVGIETFKPRFTYHGFRYVEVQVEGDGDIVDLEMRIVHTSFASLGYFKSSDTVLNTLQKCTCWSYIGNFVGIPTDCPHREKNGWTGDALLAAETGLLNFDAASSYRQWLENFRDIQRPSGQLPGIVPTGGWGFNWGSGPAWDSAFILIPWYIYLYDGDSTAIAENYAHMKRYLEFCGIMSEDFILDFGLGDWCHHDHKKITPVSVTSTGYYYADAVVMAKCAAILGCAEDARQFQSLADSIRQAFNSRFYHGGGSYADDSVTAIACALHQGLVEDSEREVTAARLADKVRDRECIADFGILGAKYVPRALAEHGYIDLAYRMVTQDKYPGWGYWLKQGATTLWETWKGEGSRNHVMFGDVSAWMYRYLGGLIPLEDAPGFRHFRIAPQLPEELDSVEMEHRGIVSRWSRGAGTFRLEVVIPKGSSAEIVLPDGSCHNAGAGKSFYECEV